ncbi:MAG: RDD family protein, partial [Nanoarchaeota archaeon]|nr:RDD family protein [Nanoarchaeota archaeon]
MGGLLYNLSKGKLKLKNAGFFKKLGSFVIDVLLLFFFIYSPVMNIMLDGSNVPTNSTEEAMLFLENNPSVLGKVESAFFFLSIVYFLYFFVTEWFNASTFGEYFLGLRVKSYQGEKPSVLQLVLRNTVKSFFTAFYFLDLLFM